MEKQKVIIDELREKIYLPLDNLNKLSNDELKTVVDSAISQVREFKLQLEKSLLKLIILFKDYKSS